PSDRIEDLSVFHDLDLLPVGVADVDGIVGVDCQAGSHHYAETGVRPFFDEFAIHIEDLHARAVGMVIHDDEAAFGIHLYPVHFIELAGLVAFNSADDPDELSVFRVLHDAMVHITVGNVDITVWRNENVARAIEGILGGVVAFNAFRADRHDLLSVFRELV